MRHWIEVAAAFDSAPEDWSPFANAFTEYGCTSSLQSDNPPALRGYLEGVAGAEQTAESLKTRLIELGANRVEISEQPDEDWSEIWKQFFKPTRIGKRFVVVPSWETFEASPDDLILSLDPGQAFGTGEHPTTRLCLGLLERVVQRGDEVLDLGCGSGILAIAAAKLGASKVVATDIEPAAVEIATENAARNGVEIEFFAGPGFGPWAEGRTWDVVVSNIISATLIRLAPEASGYVRSGGYWIVSGVLESNWPDVRTAAECSGFETAQIETEDDWIGALFHKR